MVQKPLTIFSILHKKERYNMNIVTSVTIFNDAVGKRMSVSYSEIDETTGKIISDNKRIDRIVVDTDIITIADQLKNYAQTFINSAE